jgi:hypothetical protein
VIDSLCGGSPIYGRQARLWTMRIAYEKSVCERLCQAQPVPFRWVSFADGSTPQIGCCHENVDKWVKEHSGSTAVRGWVVYMAVPNGIQLTAHSVVRDSDGQLLDITPLSDDRIRRSMRFVPHLGDDQLFLSIKGSCTFITCSQEQSGC